MSDQIEGRRPVVEALRAGRPIQRILLARGIRDQGGAVADIRREAAGRGIEIREVPRAEIERRARSRVPQGVIAIVGGFAYADLDDVVAAAERRGEPLLTLALDGVTDPHNLGALARSAEAAGAHGLLLPRRRSAPVTPAAGKAAAGAFAHLPVAQVDNLARALRRLQDAGVWVVALDGDAEHTIYDLQVAAEPVCLVVGAEGAGVSRLVRERADLRCRIPLAGRVGSLNASVAGGVALFELRRRRAEVAGP